MTEAELRAKLRALAEQATWTGHWYYAGCGTVHCTYGKSDAEHDEIAHPCPVGVAEYIAAANPSAVLALLDLIAELEQQLVAEAAKTAAEKLRADQMTEQHRMQAAMNAEARAELASIGAGGVSPLMGAAGDAGWQPIETEPGDGGRVALLRRPCGAMADGFWLAQAYAGNGAWVWPYVHKAPTHWMPLPPSPSSADEGGSNG